jgi:monothiol glutaredoxin
MGHTDLEPAVRERIGELISSDRVFLFMKGRRGAPQCGFSATVTQFLDQLVADYSTFDVLQDPAVREGIKTFSSWPTIPQLYVGGEFVGGCDIITEMFQSGELEDALGVPRATGNAPNIEISDDAARALRELSNNSPGRELHLGVDARFQKGLYFGPAEPGEVEATSNGIRLFMSPHTAARADGLLLDAEITANGPAFRIEIPGEPKVGEMTVSELKKLLDAGEALQLYDVRTPEEIATARIEGAQPFDAEAQSALAAMPRDTLVVFHCHHGGRSLQAAEQYAAMGFTRVYNLVGGIDAWSREIDSDVARY